MNLMEDQHKEWRNLFEQRFSDHESKLMDSAKKQKKSFANDFEADKDGGVGVSKSAIEQSIKALKEEVL